MQRRVNIGVALRWDPVGTANYEQRYKGTPDSNYGSAATVSGYQTTSVVISGLTLGTSYDFQVRSKENTSGGWGNFTACAPARADTAGMVANAGQGTGYLYARGNKYVASAFTTARTRRSSVT